VACGLPQTVGKPAVFSIPGISFPTLVIIARKTATQLGAMRDGVLSLTQRLGSIWRIGHGGRFAVTRIAGIFFSAM